MSKIPCDCLTLLNYRKLTSQCQFTKVTSANLRVGDIIKVHHNERVPADLLLLYTTEKSGGVFIRTDQLDGETDWKLRKAVTMTQNSTINQSPPENIIKFNAQVVANPPTDQIYDFKGYYQHGGDFE